MSAPDSAIARSFQARGSMPAPMAAGSFCLIASSDSPNRERATARFTASAITSSTTASSTYTRWFANCMYAAGASRIIGSVTSW